jgi:hypothetical protein
MSCFERLTRPTYCPAIGDFVDPTECTVCQDAGCSFSRASQERRWRSLR